MTDLEPRPVPTEEELAQLDRLLRGSPAEASGAAGFLQSLPEERSAVLLGALEAEIRGFERLTLVVYGPWGLLTFALYWMASEGVVSTVFFVAASVLYISAALGLVVLFRPRLERRYLPLRAAVPYLKGACALEALYRLSVSSDQTLSAPGLREKALLNAAAQIAARRGDFPELGKKARRFLYRFALTLRWCGQPSEGSAALAASVRRWADSLLEPKQAERLRRSNEAGARRDPM
jgi:hypothetical protein